MNIEEDFLDFWNSKYKKKLISQFRPQKKIYLDSESDLKYNVWLKENRYKDYIKV